MSSQDPSQRGSLLAVREAVGSEGTETVAAELAQTLSSGDVVLLDGEMGAGKTTFVRGAVRALGSSDRVSSPTFTLGRRYEGGRLGIAHIDLHRLSYAEGALAGEVPGLLDEYLEPDSVCFIEWPELLGPGDLPAGRRVHEVRIAIAGDPWEGRRRIEIWEPRES